MTLKRLLLVLTVMIPLRYGSAETVATLLYPSSEITLSAATHGTLESIAVREGDEVAKDAMLVQLESSEEQLLIERLEKVVEKRRFDSEGLEQLRAKHMASETDAMQARIDWELAVIDLKNARSKLSQKRLVAPIGGVITRLEKEIGEWVQPGEKVVEMIDLAELHAVFYLPYEEARLLAVGQQLDVELPQVQPAPVAARIFFISPRVDASSGLITVKASIENKDRRLHPGLAGTITLPSAPGDAASLRP